MRVQVLPYSQSWPLQFEELKAELENLTKDVAFISIEHVGSTSVPGLAAKPIIDIDIVIAPKHLPDVIAALTKNGDYAYMGEWGIPGRHAFRKPAASIPHNLYVCIRGCQGLRNHLAVRDLCRADPEVRDKYGQLKIELATREWETVDEYCDAKSDMLSWILEKAGMSEEDVRQIAEQNDFEAQKLKLGSG